MVTSRAASGRSPGREGGASWRTVGRGQAPISIRTSHPVPPPRLGLLSPRPCVNRRPLRQRRPNGPPTAQVTSTPTMPCGAISPPATPTPGSLQACSPRASVPTVTGSRLAAGSCPGTRVVADRTARAMDAFERTSLPDVECSSAAQEVLGPDRCTRTPACVGTSTSEGRCRQSGPSGLVRRPVGRRPPASITRGPDWSRYRRRTASRLAIAASWTPMVR